MSYIQLTYKPIPEKLPIPLTTWVLGPKIERKNNIGKVPTTHNEHILITNWIESLFLVNFLGQTSFFIYLKLQREEFKENNIFYLHSLLEVKLP